MLEVIDVSKSFKERTAVSHVNFFIEKGEVVGLLGPNGAGKSTTISMISSLVAPSAGEIFLGGYSVKKHRTSIRRMIGVVPQEIALFQDLTAQENLRFFGRAYQLKGNELQERVEHVLEIVGLSERADEFVKTYSGGMKRRLNIAVALLHEPELLIMDEPTVGIDPQSRSYILETVRELNRTKNMTIIYTSHYMEEVEYLCDRIYIMDHGEIIAAGSKKELKAMLMEEDSVVVTLSEPAEKFAEKLRENPAITHIHTSGEEAMIRAVKDTPVLESVIQLTRAAGVDIKSVEVRSPSLEDVFLHLTGRTLRQ
ncbi:ABC transporter ATP-binding protein [Salisediminibacterium halotolerans]|uniref:ABC-2 type transport system ATP-binding protein n=1 Tax=Salisediminibacterium halotolerans TaxID=517425 RepID=A0A1H9SY41_9BACI|nr:ABC transporter ATP-binding protein [Salisediminibacterium haloalkalitolerans]SER89950.1 ABC-2 type transport system ATP-binding protein [Salisediminibacterium haloalkalitolerans]